MIEELKQIKKLYGEAMMHYCRNTFATILETEGVLLEILKSKFAESHELYNDLVKEEMLEEFKQYLFSLMILEEKKVNNIDKTPKELLKMAGYTLYECKTEEDIQFFKKYYAPLEELCTFRGRRLDSCYVFFAVKDNVNEIKRENFSNPERQDKYGTSVISIQFSRDDAHTLSIKNRYNHTVVNPDATFGNNLDNIIPGLTDSFAIYYGLEQKHINDGFEFSGYVRANDGRWYRYNNQEIGNVYYCPNNIIIDNGEVKKYAKEKYIVMDYFILDLVDKKIRLYDSDNSDSFPETVGSIKNATITKKETEKVITILNDKEEVFIITLDKDNRIIGLESNIKEVGDHFLARSTNLTNLKLPNLKQVGNYFLCYTSLTYLELLSLVQVGDRFVGYNKSLTHLELPSLQQVGRFFLAYNDTITHLKLPALQQVEGYFLENNKSLTHLELPSLKQVEDFFLWHNDSLTYIELPALEQAGYLFFFENTTLTNFSAPNLYKIGDNYFEYNPQIQECIKKIIEINQGMKK